MGPLFFCFFIPPVCFFLNFLFVCLSRYCIVVFMLSLFLGRLRCFFVFCPASFCCFVAFIFYPVNFCYFIDALPLFLFPSLSLFRFFLFFFSLPCFFLSVFFFAIRRQVTLCGGRPFGVFYIYAKRQNEKKLDCRREKSFLRYVISKILVIFRGFAVLKSHKFESLFGGHLFRVFFRLSYAFADAIGV